MPNKTELPKSPTRERRVYLACVRIYVNLFRAVFAAPLEARRSFRRLAESRTPDAALDLLWTQPETFGAQRSSVSHVHDPAFVYWTQRPRRPRALLKLAAAGIARELARRDHQRIVEDARSAEQKAHGFNNTASASRTRSLLKSGALAMRREAGVDNLNGLTSFRSRSTLRERCLDVSDPNRCSSSM